jgi:hypothetical protein
MRNQHFEWSTVLTPQSFVRVKLWEGHVNGCTLGRAARSGLGCGRWSFLAIGEVCPSVTV